MQPSADSPSVTLSSKFSIVIPSHFAVAAMDAHSTPRSKRQSTKTHQASPQKAPSNHLSIYTPEKKKRVRFSDPFPTTSTGLTPFLGRTSMTVCSPPPPLMMSPRRTAPSSSARTRLRKVKSERWSSPAISPVSDTSPLEMQFKPIRQVLDERAARRIRRNGLGEEVEKWEKTKRDVAKRSKAEISALKEELEALRQKTSGNEKETPIDIEALPSFEDQAIILAAHSAEPIPHTHTTVQVAATVNEDDDATIPFSDVNLDHSGFRGVPENFDDTTESEASTIIADSLPDHTAALLPQGKVQELSRMIEINKDQHQRLISKLEEYLPDECDPSDFEAVDAALDTALTTLTMAESYANDSWAAFEILDNEIKELGFPGDDAQEMLEELKQQFRQARLELEYMNPGETAFGFDNQKLLDKLVAKVRELKKHIDIERQESKTREAQLQDYAERLRKRLDAAQKALKAVAREDVQKDTSISRLQIALRSYRQEVAGLEKLIEDIDTKHRHSMKDLQGRLRREQTRTRDGEAGIRQMREDIGKLQASLKHANTTIASLQASKMGLEMLVKKQKASQSGDVETMQAEIRNLLTKVNDLRNKQVVSEKASLGQLCMDPPTPPASSAPGTPTCDGARPTRRRYDSGFGILPEVEDEDGNPSLML